MTMICAQCGATNDDGQRFCYNCGARLADQQAPTVEAPRPLQMPPPPAPIDQAGYPQAPGQYQPYQAYPQAPTGYVPQVVPNSGLAITSLVAGIVGWIMLPFIAAIVAVITGHMARREVRQSGGRLAGEGMALAGMILGYTQLALMVLGVCFMLFFVVIAAA